MQREGVEMSKPPDTSETLSETLKLSEYQSPRNGGFGFWLWDTTQEMNLAMRAKTERAAFVEALHYYQKRLTTVEKEHRALTEKVNVFVAQFVEEGL
jgi:hypothetical protein